MVTSHLGRPTEGELKPEDSLAPVAARLGELLGRDGAAAADWVDGVEVAPGEVVLLENCRVNKGEKKNDEALARKLAALCDVFVQRRVRHRAPRRGQHLRHRAVRADRLRRPAAGRRDRRDHARRWPQPKRPLVAIVAGSQGQSPSSRILQSLAKNVDRLIVGGGIANTFLLAAGPADRQVAGRARPRRRGAAP